MEIHVILESTDLLTGKKNILADGTGDLSMNRLIYAEKEDPSVYHEIIFQKDEILIKRKAEISSVTHLIRNQDGKASVYSPWGIMELGAQLEKYEVEEDRRVVEYRILNGKETATWNRLEWKWEGISDE